MAESSVRHSSESKRYIGGLLRGWKKPGDVITLLMIMNGDVVQKALAQLSGPTFVPVAFSFGWVVYSIQAFSSVIGTGRLMPAAPDVESIVVNVGSGHSRPNRSWILGRLLRDWDYDPTIEQGLYVTVLDAVSRSKVVQEIYDKYDRPLLPGQADDIELAEASGGLQITRPGSGLKDYYMSGLTKAQSTIFHVQAWWKILLLDKGSVWIFAWPVIGLQFCIACVPLMTHNDASTLIITAVGTLLAIWHGALPRWKEEKQCCRNNTRQNFCLLEGNGAAHIMVVCGNGAGLNFEDLAGGRVPRKRYTILWTSVLSLLSVGLLITIAREEGQTWFLKMVGGLGIFQNIVVAGSPRPASALGFYLKKRTAFYRAKVRDALRQADLEVPGVGGALRPIYFPGKATNSDDEAFGSAGSGRDQQHEQGLEHNQTATTGTEMEEATSSGRAGGESGNVGVGSRRTHGGDGD
ncbi:MAG: hypothetical protein Q9226_004688 [Calogaya cf. arnoldii]